MNVSYVWKILSGLPLAEKVLILFLFAGAIVGAFIALWNAVPLAFEYSADMWHRRMRRKARRRWYTTRATASQRANVVDGRNLDALPHAAPNRGLSLNVWLAVAGCSAVSVLGGVALGYLLNRQPDHSSLSASLTEAARDPARLRIDYELRNR
jgi:uncharacterized protein YneF (UPF0154 family)